MNSHTFGFGAKPAWICPRRWRGLVGLEAVSGLSIGRSPSDRKWVSPRFRSVRDQRHCNGGYRSVSIVDRIIDENGELVRPTAPNITRIIRRKPPRVVRDAFEGVVAAEHGRQAALDGIGRSKTGTAQKDIRPLLRHQVVLPSSALPAAQPKITVLVQIDEPKASSCGEVSAPFSQSLRKPVKLHVPWIRPAAPARAGEPAIAAKFGGFPAQCPRPSCPWQQRGSREDKVGDGTVTFSAGPLSSSRFHRMSNAR